MAAVAQTNTYTAIGDREDLTDLIFIITPTETPVVSSMSEEMQTYRLHEWQTYALAATSTAGAIEGETISFTSGAARVRVGNYLHILSASVSVSDIQRLVNVAGVADEYAWELDQKTKILTRNLEATVIQSASASGASGTAPNMNGLQAVVTTNAATAGAVRDFTRAVYLAGMKVITDAGGNPDLLVAKNAVALDIADWPATIGGGTASAAVGTTPQDARSGAIYDGTWRTINDPWGTRTIKYDRVGILTATASGGVFALDTTRLRLGVLDRLHVSRAAKVGMSTDGWLQWGGTLNYGIETAHGTWRQLSNT